MFLKIIFLSRGLMLALADCEVVDVWKLKCFLSCLVDTDISILLHFTIFQGTLDILQSRF